MGSTTSAMKELKIEETIQEAVVVNNLFSMITTNKYDDDTCINYYNLMSVDERYHQLCDLSPVWSTRPNTTPN